MEKKQKIILLVIVGLLSLLFLGAMFFVGSKIIQKHNNVSEKKQSIQPKQEESQKTNPKDEALKQTSLIFMQGKISSISNNSIEFQLGETKNTFYFSNDIKVVSYDGKTTKKLDVASLKKGQTVSLGINQSDGTVASIQIFNGKNERVVF